MIKIINIFLILVCFILGGNKPVSYQKVLDNRAQHQSYIEDSTKVYWLQRSGDPFSFPTYKDRRVMSSAIKFYSELQGKVEVAILDSSTNKILHKFVVPSKGKKEYSFWLWSANQQIDVHEIPADHFRIVSSGYLHLLLLVNGQGKSLLHERYWWQPFKKGQICYLQWGN